MNRSHLAAAAAAVLLMSGCAAGVGGGSPSTAPGSAAGGAAVTLTVAQTPAGDALAGSGGKTLYVNTQEQGGSIACTGNCVSAWPPLTGSASAGSGVTGALGTVTRPDGSIQVTYNGSPLYYYSGDASAGDSNGQGVGGVWYIAAPAGSSGSSSSPIPSTAASSGYRY